MPANLTHEYRRAEQLFREAQTTDEKIEALQLMLSTIPKHKGTDHMQADIKRRLAKLQEGGQGKAGARRRDVFHIERGVTGGQVMLLGMPNAGKSALVAALTNAPVTVADYPFSTTAPVPGVALHEDVPIQMVDMPPITAEHVEPGQVHAYRQCDLVLLVVDLNAADTTEEMETCLAFMAERHLWVPPGANVDDEFARRMARPVLGVATKSDLVEPGDFEVLRELYGRRLELLCCSVNDPASLARLAARLFELLHIVRVYSKIPGQEADLSEPFILPAGATVTDLANKVHRELAEKLRYARGWGQGLHDGQNVPRDHVLHDKDVIELHFP